MKTNYIGLIFGTASLLGLVMATESHATTASYVHIFKNDTADTRLHISEVEAFANLTTPNELGGATFDNKSTSTNDIGDGTLTTYGDGNQPPTLGTTATLEHGGANKNPNNLLELGGSVWSTANGLAGGAQYTLDLGGSHDVTTVRMWPRADTCCSTRWMNLEIQLLDENQAPIPGTLQLHTADVGNVALEFTFQPTSPDIEMIVLDPAVTFPTADDAVVLSTAPAGTPVGSLAATNEFGNPLPGAEFSLVAGAGDTNNALYSIGGPGDDQLLVSGSLDVPNDTVHSVRIFGEAGGGVPLEQIITFTIKLDSDSDGLIDDWETQFGALSAFASGADADDDALNDEDEFINHTDPSDNDTDDDGSGDGDELANRTNPLDPDTDGDDLNDGDEAIAGSDPLNPDTDGDTLGDGSEVEANPYSTDPTKVDTDGDNFADNLEIDLGSDPTDPNSVPAVPVVTIIAGLIGGDLTDPENDVNDTLPCVLPNCPGLDVLVSSSNTTDEGWSPGDGVGNEKTYDIFDNKVGGGEAKWCCDGPPQSVTVEFEEPVSITHFTITSGNDTPDRDPRDFQIQGSNDGETFDPIYIRASDEVIWTARNQTARIDLPTPSNAYKFIRYEVTRTIVNHQINEIEYFGTVGAPILFQITSIELDEAADTITLTWNSRNNRTYAVFFSGDLSDFGADVNDSIPSGGDTTTFTFDNPNPGARRLYFRAVENN